MALGHLKSLALLSVLCVFTAYQTTCQQTKSLSEKLFIPNFCQILPRAGLSTNCPVTLPSMCTVQMTKSNISQQSAVKVYKGQNLQVPFHYPWNAQNKNPTRHWKLQVCS